MPRRKYLIKNVKKGKGKDEILDMLDNSINVNVSEGKGIQDAMTKTLNPLGLTESKYAGELHAKSYNFLGPGTRLDKRLDKNDKPLPNSKPINYTDQQAYKHDIAYKKINKKYKDSEINKNEAIEMIHTADDEFINALKNKTGLNFTGKLAEKAIGIKKVLEKLGLLPHSVFSLKGSGGDEIIKESDKILSEYQDPLKELRKELENKTGKKKQTGGVFLSILAPIISFLASEGLTKLITHLQKGKGKNKKSILDKPRKDQIRYVIEELEKKPPEKQIDMVTNVLKKEK
jgi:hypothetical protein